MITVPEADDLLKERVEVSLVMCSVAILTKRRNVWLASGAVALGGVLVALTAFRLH